MQSTTRTAARGFASMDAEKQREIAKKGGKAAHVKGTAHEFTREEARAAGRKGGERVSANREHMSRIGRIGGKSSAGKRQQTRTVGSGQPGQTSEHADKMNPETSAQQPAAESHSHAGSHSGHGSEAHSGAEHHASASEHHGAGHHHG